MSSTKPKSTLLIVEDEASLRDLLAELLSGMAGVVKTAADGKEALSLVGSGTIDAVLSDIKMPVMNGLELLAKVRSMNLETPFVFLTGHGDKDQCIEALRLGATDFLEKPFNPRTVIDIMQKALALGQAMREVAEETDKLFRSPSIPVDYRIKLQKKQQALLMMRKMAQIYSKAS